MIRKINKYRVTCRAIIFTLIDEVIVDGFPPPTCEDGVFPSDFLLGSLKVFFFRQKLRKADVTFAVEDSETPAIITWRAGPDGGTIGVEVTGLGILGLTVADLTT